jgi:hypothetical protein
MSAGSKRERESEHESEEEQEKEKSLRPEPWKLVALLATHCSEGWIPKSLEPYAQSAGIMGVDAWLSSLGRSVADALTALPAHAETARANLRAVRASLVAATLRCDAVEKQLDDAEAVKIARLENELYAIDKVLTRVRETRALATQAVSALVPAIMSTRDSSPDSRIDMQELLADAERIATQYEDVESEVCQLPTCVLEPLCLDFVAADNVLDVGTVVAPRPATALDFVRTNKVNLCYKLTNPQLEAQSDAEIEHTLRTAAAASRFWATSVAPELRNKCSNCIMCTEYGYDRFDDTCRISYDLKARCLVVCHDKKAPCWFTLTIAGRKATKMNLMTKI